MNYLLLASIIILSPFWVYIIFKFATYGFFNGRELFYTEKEGANNGKENKERSQ